MLAALAACTESGDTIVSKTVDSPNTLTVASSNVELAAGVESFELSVDSRGEAWKTIVTPAEHDWLRIMPTESDGSDASVYFLAEEDNTTYEPRSVEVLFYSEHGSRKVTVSQSGMPIEKNGLPARWYFTENEMRASGWVANRVLFANAGEGRSLASVSAVGADGRNPVCALSTAYKTSAAAMKMFTGDCLLFTVPVKSLAAGTDIDFMGTFGATDNSAPKYWMCEIFDGGEWREPEASDIKTAADGTRYSFYIKNFSSYQHTTFVQTFTLSETVRDGVLKIRCRAVGSINGGGSTLLPTAAGGIYMPSHEFHLATICAYEGIAAEDTKKVLLLGNSFTHYFCTAWKLKELARSQGHRLDMRINIKGSQTFANHLALELSQAAINEGGYDYAFLQEQSQAHAKYYADPVSNGQLLTDMRNLSAQVMQHSPSCRVVLENTWAFPKSGWDGHGSSSAFEAALLAGAKAIAAADTNVACVSPIGVAFDKAYASGITDLWYTDSKHPNINGAYLKACVNYLVLFGEQFDDNAADCGVAADTAAKLRAIAEDVVLGHESEYGIER